MLYDYIIIYYKKERKKEIQQLVTGTVPLKSIQIKSLLLSHHHSTSALVSEILTSVLQTVQKNNNLHMDSTFTDCTEDNVQNTHTNTQYTQCIIKTYLVINTHYIPYVHIFIMYTSIHSIM